MRTLLENKIILTISTIVLILSFIITPFLAFADFNQQINYQGKLTDSSGVAVADGTYNMKFWLIASSTAATSTAVWAETRISGDKVQVTNGLFSVMLGEVSSLASVDFNQTLYLGVEIGGSGSPTWDGEMTPRKILGAVPAAFEAENAQTLAGIATTSFLRSDAIDTMEATSSSALLTLIQNGAGKLLSVFSGVTEMFTILNNGNVGIATTTPSEKLTVIGNTYLGGGLTLTGALKDSTIATGTLGMVLKTTGTSTQWVATSTLGLGNGTFLGLTDTPSSFTANRLLFTNSGGTALTDSANLVFDGTNLGIGSTTPSSNLTVVGSSYISDKLLFDAADTESGVVFPGDNYLAHSSWKEMKDPTGILLPMYLYPSDIYNNTSYNGVIDLKKRYHNVPLYVVLNPSNGSGGVTDGNFTAAIQRLKGAGAIVLGYVASNYTASTTAEVEGEIDDWVTYYPDVDGIFIDEMTNTASTTAQAYYNELTRHVHSRGLYPSIGNPGAGTVGEYFASSSADVIVINETSSYPSEVTLKGDYDNGYADFDYNKRAGLVYGISDLSTASTTLLKKYLGMIYVTDDTLPNPWDTVSPHLEDLFEMLSAENKRYFTDLYIDGNIGIATTTPSEKLTVIGNTYLNGGLTLTGALKDSTSATGTLGMIMQTTGTSTQWVATSTLGLGNGTFLGLTDTPSSFTANRLMFTNSGGTALTDSANLVFDGTDLGLTGTTGLLLGGDTKLYRGFADTLYLDSGDSLNIVSGSIQIASTTVISGTREVRAGNGADNSPSFTFSSDTNTGLFRQAADSIGFTTGGTERLRLTTSDLDFQNGGIAFGGTRYLYASSTNDSIVFGENAGASFNSGTTFNVALGYEAGRYASSTNTDYNNTLGYFAGYNNVSHRNNILGYYAGYNNSGARNNIFGDGAGYNNSGSANEIIGYEAGYTNSGTGNVLMGGSAGKSNTGSYNNIFGTQSGFNNTGSYNNIFGYYAGHNNNGNYNEIFGYQAGQYMRSTSSIVIGSQALRGDGLGVFTTINNIAIGYQAGYNATTSADNNILIGYKSADNLTTGANNIVIGYDVDIASTTRSNQLNIGNLIFGTGIDGTGTTLSSGNIGIGSTTPSSKLTVSGSVDITNTATSSAGITLRDTIGGISLELRAGTSTLANTFVGLSAGSTNSTGINNSALGKFALKVNTTGSQNTANGASALATNSSGSDNTAIGSASQLLNTTGSYNTVAGSNSLVFNQTGFANTVFGNEAGYGAISQSFSSSTLMGYRAGFAITSGSRNTLLGYRAGDAITSGQGNIILGYDIDAPSATGNNQLSIGNLIFGTSLDGTGTTLSTGKIGIGSTTPSSKLTVAGSVDITNTATSSAAIILRDTSGRISLELRAGTSTLFNTFVGVEAGKINSSGIYNTAVGYQSLYSNTTGGYNVALGLNSLYNNATGTRNTALGFSSMAANTGGGYNAALGYNSMGANISGSFNTALGYVALNSNRNASSTVAVGYAAAYGQSNYSNQGGVYVGFQSGFNASSSSDYNTMIGYQSGYGVTTGARNILLGYNAGYSSTNLTTGSDNIIIGNNIGATSTSMSKGLNIGNLIFGTSLDGTGTTLSSGNIGIGTTTPSSKLTVVGDVNIQGTATSSAIITLRDPIGGVSMEIRAGTSTLENTFIGLDAGRLNTTGGSNVALGVSAMSLNTTGGSNTAVGWQALYSNATGTNNTASGFRSLYSNTGSDNTAYGYGSLRLNTIGSENTAVGLNALALNVDGSRNTAVGIYALSSNVDGDNNTAIGYSALDSNVTGKDNTAIGRAAGFDINTAVNTGANTIIGYNTGRGIVTGVNNTVIGANVTGLSSALSNNIIIADGAGNRRINVDSSGNVGIATTTPVSLLAMEKLTFTGAGIAGINQNLKSTNVTASAVQYGNFGYLYASNTATTTIAGNMFKIEDNTTFGNTVRGFEVQTDRGTNTLGENTALSGFARTFGVRGTTKGDAGGTYEPAGVFAETQGTTQGNAIRGYSASITTTSLLKLFQDTSTFVGTGLLMNFGNSGGSFSSTTASKFIDLQNAGTSMFTVGAYGALTIGDGTTNHNAGLAVGYGGICVDNDGSCNASTTGRVSAVSYHTGNSDLAETYFSSENLKTGDVVYIKNGLSIGKAGENNKDKVIGVVSTKPGLLLGSDDASLKAGEKAYPIALKGRVPVRLSNENGEIKVGDELMLSSVEGVVMKATSTGKIVGVALEDFEGSRAYSDTYINQFGDDLVDPVFEPINHDSDPRINDGCYFGGGNASGDEVCVPLVSTTTDGQIAEAEAIAKREAEERALAKLATVSSEKLTLSNGQEVKVGQIVMFVDLRHRYLDDNGVQMMSALLASASTTNATEVSETVWQRVVNLANNFVDGVLSVFTLKADKVEVKDQLCVDGVCVTGDDLRQLLNKNNNSDSGEGDDNPEPVVEEVIENNSEEENVETTVVEEPVAPPLQESPILPSEPVIPIPEIIPEPPAPEPLPESTPEPIPENIPVPEPITP